jgi:hypothetical protein
MYNIFKKQGKVNIKIKIYKTLLKCKGVKHDLARYGNMICQQAADDTFKREELHDLCSSPDTIWVII